MASATRRTFVAGLSASSLGLSVLSPSLGLAAEGDIGDPPVPFSFDALTETARASAEKAYQAPLIMDADVLDAIDYDQHWAISFRKGAGFKVGEYPVEYFHRGRFAREPVRIHRLVPEGSRRVHYENSLFSMPPENPANDMAYDAGFAGFRLMRPGNKPDWLSFLGASYFRCDGPEAQYGLSARGLAIDSGLTRPEEFPRFSTFYVGAGEREGEEATIYARLTSQSVEGAYRFGVSRVPNGIQTMAVEARLFFRSGVERLGIAPLTSMYWYSQANRRAGGDWRPEIHDSDGLALHTGTGERIWRPLRNPERVVTTSFFDTSPGGFGLIQRDREFAHYQDDGVFYNRRPSAWVAPTGDWGAGKVQLIEIPTGDETFDNIVAYWSPQRPPVAGDAISLSYELTWRERDPKSGEIAKTVATWMGEGGVPGQPIPPDQTKVVVDFAGGTLDTLKEGAELEVSARGANILRPSARPIVSGTGWRAIFDLKPTGPEPPEVRAFLHKAGIPLTETWTMPVLTGPPRAL